MKLGQVCIKSQVGSDLCIILLQGKQPEILQRICQTLEQNKSISDWNVYRIPTL